MIEILRVHERGIKLLNRILELTLLLSVEAAGLQVVDGHEYACEVAHLGQFLRGDLLGLRLQLILLVLDSLEALLQLRNVVVKLHYLSLHVLLIGRNCRL